MVYDDTQEFQEIIRNEAGEGAWKEIMRVLKQRRQIRYRARRVSNRIEIRCQQMVVFIDLIACEPLLDGSFEKRNLDKVEQYEQAAKYLRRIREVKPGTPVVLANQAAMSEVVSPVSADGLVCCWLRAAPAWL